MNLCIVNGPRIPGWSDPRYRGVWRGHPTFCNALSAEHEINRLFVDWFLVEGGETGIVRNLDKAVRYAKLCNEHFPGQHFEVVEFTDSHTAPEICGQFLGYDLSSSGGHSILQGGHQSWTMEIKVTSPADVLWMIIRLYFEPRLNEFRLFQRLEDASLCLEAMTSLQSYRPGFFEGCDLDRYQPKGIYLVWGQSVWPPVADGHEGWQHGATREAGSP